MNLPVHKYIFWNKDIQQIISESETTHNKIKTINGRLTHAAYIFRPARFFLNRLRQLERRCERFFKQKNTDEEKKDFILWSEFLEQLTTEGVSINNITNVIQDAGAFSDACEHGLGGYTTQGSAFSYEIPPEYRGIFHINLLEFISAK